MYLCSSELARRINLALCERIENVTLRWNGERKELCELTNEQRIQCVKQIIYDVKCNLEKKPKETATFIKLTVKLEVFKKH